MPSYRLLCAGDLHKLHKDISTIVGYSDNTIRVQKALMAEMKKLGVTHFLCLSDWYHKGYSSDVAAGLADVDLDIQMSRELNGNVYSVIGNHINLNMDSNPELHLIQPHPTLKSRREVQRKEQIFKTVDSLMLNGVQISFCHYKLSAKSPLDYRVEINPHATYHIALYHTHLVVPYSKLTATGMNYNAASNTDIGTALTGVDYAVVGDIHKPLGQFKVNTASGECMMCVPGSLTNTDAGLGSRHTSINLPMFDISEDGKVTVSQVPFDLRTNNLTFKDIATTKELKLDSTRGNTVDHMYQVDASGRTSLRDFDLKTMSLTDFLDSEGYTEADKKMMLSVVQSPEDAEAIFKIMEEANEQ